MGKTNPDIIKLIGRVTKFTPISSNYDRSKWKIFRMKVDIIVNLTQNYSETAASGVTALLVYPTNDKFAMNLTDEELISVDGIVDRMPVTRANPTDVFMVRSSCYVSAKGY